METQGWLLDVYPLHDRMVLWVRRSEGKLLRFEDPFRFPIYAAGKRRILEKLAEGAVQKGFAAGFFWDRKVEFWSGREIEVLALELADYGRLPALLRKLPSLEETVSFFNCDIPLAQYYLYSRGLFPLGRCGVECEGDQVQDVRPLESPWDLEYAVPDLSIMEISVEGSHLLPLGKGNTLAVRCDGKTLVFEPGSPEDLLRELSRLLQRHDPDLILTDHGDSFIIPSLLRLSDRWRIPLPLDREPTPIRRAIVTQGRSYFTYGQIVYNAPDYPFFGRLHIDRENSFFYSATGFEGIIEAARLSKIPIQRLARRGSGTAISSMQLDRALQDRILVPWRKGEPEKFKTAWGLLVADKGGLTYQPVMGMHDNVAEIDYSSMYPTIMVRHNISAETILCDCCPRPKVPEAGYNICEKREGLVPRTLRPILERRRYFRSKKKTAEGFEKEIYSRKQTALKWLLVVCFGYLGYRNARFGRIEAHEAVTAYGREKLLQAKELSEARGFRVLHALTDAVWITKPGMTRPEVLDLCAEIGKAADVPIELEGIYKWVVFLPSKVRKNIPVATRYFGAFGNGELKARGLAFRRDDTPPLIKEAQEEMLHLLSTCANSQEYRERSGEVREVLASYLTRLETGDLKNEDLLVAKSVRQKVNEYKVDNLTSLALKQLDDAGIEIHPGEKVHYLIKDSASKNKEDRVRAHPFVGADDDYDEEKYRELLEKAAEEVGLMDSNPPPITPLPRRERAG
jgi:DNA polymerase-2